VKSFGRGSNGGFGRGLPAIPEIPPAVPYPRVFVSAVLKIPTSMLS